ncbi:thioredoxin reductase (NADPH) [Histomonas meleagridis]|uniref:thioredoxin reductase (NADPH) n=1 Tax=Histomonas meleagridis TaxID=135588 RepID=UPI00355A1AAE|nr:thioredoxin reductase (NADPH) [Histomonas meleagridis]KAH0807151.1 thioredoxin reductase (NADPH) [Histomonas meleagridis]
MLFLFLFAIVKSELSDDDMLGWGIDDDDEGPIEIKWDEVPVSDAIILGSGPAGSTAALYLARAGYSPLVLHGNIPRGQLVFTTEIENFPGFTGTGPELVKKIQSQAEAVGAKYEYDVILNVSFSEYPFKLQSESKGYKAKSVIIATGANAKFLKIDSVERLRNRGVSACAVCDGPLYKDQPVAVVGGGDVAIEEALYLSKICSSVKLIHRRGQLRASLPMRQKLENSTIEVIWNTVVKEAEGDEFLTGVVLENVNTGEVETLHVNALFLAIGHEPATALFKGQIDMDQDGYIIHKNGQATNVPGIFVAGDCADKVFRQAITSAGSGCQAALLAERFLSEQN